MQMICNECYECDQGEENVGYKETVNVVSYQQILFHNFFIHHLQKMKYFSEQKKKHERHV